MGLVYRVLIETLWNVKFKVFSLFLYALGINRNIVECKVQYIHLLHYFVYRINRNIVECKDREERVLSRFLLVLIETL